MLFNSPEFIVLFLPLTLLIFFSVGGWGYYRLANVVLLLASFFFYSWWNPANLAVLISSILFNYLMGALLVGNSNQQTKKLLLIVGIAANLVLLGYFKYTNFFLNIANSTLSTDFTLRNIILPLGISFFTFQQIAYLVDSYRGELKEKYSLLNYSVFVTFFPHLLAGPLLHHKNIISQFSVKSVYQFSAKNLEIGITIFVLGLFKKVVLADSVAVYANQIFDAASNGVSLTFIEAWVGALAYTVQLYFDFSGYSDMAIGIAKMFGIELPINFNSPYKAINIIDFWRRWHITLANFLRDYLYIPLGGNRKGDIRRNLNLMITMLACGLWHGAGWSFVVWGGLHGILLLINHQWRRLRQTVLNHDLQASSYLGKRCSHLITFLAVVGGWVIFRAADLTVAGSVLRGMIGLNGISFDSDLRQPLAFMQAWGVQFNEWMPNIVIKIEELDDITELHPTKPILAVAVLVLLTWVLPNTQQWVNYLQRSQTADQTVPASMQRFAAKVWQWQPNQVWAVILAGLTVASLLKLSEVSEFLYFEF